MWTTNNRAVELVIITCIPCACPRLERAVSPDHNVTLQ